METPEPVRSLAMPAVRLLTETASSTLAMVGGLLGN